MTLHDMLTQIIQREGGYVDHPADRGGPTKFGIRQETLADWRGHDVTADDVRALTENEARSIYTARYFMAPGFDKVPHEDLQAALLDAAVHHGPIKAVQLLQRSLGIRDDGVLGPVTLAALPHLDPRRVCLKFLARRIRLLGLIVSNNPSQAVFAAGWANRVADQIEGLA